MKKNNNHPEGNENVSMKKTSYILLEKGKKAQNGFIYWKLDLEVPSRKIYIKIYKWHSTCLYQIRIRDTALTKSMQHWTASFSRIPQKKSSASSLKFAQNFKYNKWRWKLFHWLSYQTHKHINLKENYQHRLYPAHGEQHKKWLVLAPQCLQAII